MYLTEHIAGYPVSAPQTTFALLTASPQEIRSIEDLTEEEITVILNLRKVLIQASSGGDTLVPITNAAAVKQALQDQNLLTTGYCWTIYPLDENRLRIKNTWDPHTSVIKFADKYFPSLEKLQAARAHIPPEGAYIALYGGGPEILESKKLRQAIRNLKTHSTLADVIFREFRKGSPPIIWSMRTGIGEAIDGDDFQFPNPLFLAECGFEENE